MAVDTEALEVGLRAAALRDARAMFEELLNGPLYAGLQEQARSGERRYSGRRKVIETLFGPITLVRDYFVGEEGGRFALDERLGFIEGYSPGLARLMVRIAADQSYELAAGDLRAYAGVELDPRAIARMVERVAPAMERVRKARALRGPEGDRVATLYIEADGTGVPVRRPERRGRKARDGKGEARTREVKLGCVFTQTKVDDEGHPMRDPDSTTYVSSFQGAESFGLELRREALGRGYADAQRCVFLGDGAAWVWELARVNFPQTIQILDYYHAAQPAGDWAKALYGEETPQAIRVAKQWRRLLLCERLDRVLTTARAALPEGGERRKSAEREIAYFEKNRERMRYATFRKLGLFIGSGIVEAGCKTVVGKRLKNSGMFWSIEGATNILTLRTARLGHHFDRDWDESRAAA
jgi:hypothetical protein